VSICGLNGPFAAPSPEDVFSSEASTRLAGPPECSRRLALAPEWLSRPRPFFTKGHWGGVRSTFGAAHISTRGPNTLGLGGRRNPLRDGVEKGCGVMRSLVGISVVKRTILPVRPRSPH